MLLPHLWFSLAWIAYCIAHSLLAAPASKKWLGSRLGRAYRYYRFFYSLTALLLLLVLVIWQWRMPNLKLWIPSLPGQLAGIILIILGTTGAVITLGKYIVSPEGFRGLFFEGDKPVLQVDGLHKLVRHPLYLSTFLLLGGIFFCLPYLSLLLVIVIIIVYTLLAIPLEEHKLIDVFGDEYRSYRRRVPALIPRIRAISG
jgi:protein-S-isoprenylcysteine O-methyltransferase Ste14